MKNTFAGRLVKIMDEQNLNNYELARAMGITEGTIRSWRKGETQPSKTNRDRLPIILKVSPIWLYHAESIPDKKLSKEALLLAEEASIYGKDIIKKCRQILRILKS